MTPACPYCWVELYRGYTTPLADGRTEYATADRVGAYINAVNHGFPTADPFLRGQRLRRQTRQLRGQLTIAFTRLATRRRHRHRRTHP
jgi:hypothetical protein